MECVFRPGRAFRILGFGLAAAVWGIAGAAVAGTILINIDPNGTTSNQNINSTTLFNSDTEALWPGKSNSLYRDYQIRLYAKTSGATALFDGLDVQLSARLNTQTAASNSLRYSLWSGAIPSIPSGPTSIPGLPSAIVTGTSPNSNWANASSNSYTSGIISNGSTAFGGGPITLTSDPTNQIFFFRIWAEGATNNEGYKSKIAATIPELQGVEIDSNDIGGDIFINGVPTPMQPYSPSPVPEIDPAGIGSVLALVSGALGLVERRRLKRS